MRPKLGKEYSLVNYVKKLKDQQLLVEKKLYNKENEPIRGINYHSKKIDKNHIFICKGLQFKSEYLEEAINNGAIMYIAERKYEVDREIPYVLVKDIRKAMALLASLFYDYPQKKLKIIGVGGTKGKTTTAYFFKSALDSYLSDHQKKPAGLISSLMNYDGVEKKKSELTTLESLELIQYLATAFQAGIEYFVLEVSSQALKYHRTFGITFDLAVF